MPTLPPSREIKKLGEVWNIITWSTPPKNNPNLWWGELPFIKPPHLGKTTPVIDSNEYLTKEGFTVAKPIPKNSIMVCCIWSLWKIGIAWRELCTNQQINSISFDKTKVNFKYWYYFCTTLEKIMKRIANQAVVQIINKSQFSKIPIPLPPLPTQEKIVQKLDTLSAAIEKDKKNIQQQIFDLDALRESSLSEIFDNNKWEGKKLGEVLIIERWGSPRPIKDFLTQEQDGVNWIKIGDTKKQTKYISYTAEKIKPEGVKKSRMVFPWDFILSNSMSFWKPYIMKTSWCIHDWRLILRIEKTTNIDKEYLYYLLGSPFIYEKFKKTASWTWVKNLNINKVKDIQIPLPPLKEQETIVAHLDQLHKKISILKEDYKKQLTSYEQLRASILDQAFKGELVSE